MKLQRRTALGALVGLCAVSRAQPAQRRIAWFGAGRGNLPAWPPYLDAFRSGLQETGWVEGRNLSLQLFLSDGAPDAAENRVRDMLATNPELIVAHGRDVGSLHRANPAPPVIFAFSGDPVDAGFVASYARPGGNFTGISFMSLDLAGKRIELLQELAPKIRRLAVLARPEHAGEHRERGATESVAAKLGLELAYVPIQATSGLDGALQSIARQQSDALLVFPDAVTLAGSARMAKFAIDARMPTVSGWSQFADNGFLLAYGPSLQEGFRRLGHYADRVLRGAKPAELPVELPRAVDMVLNAATARQIGIDIPPALLLRADRLIQ